MSRRRGRPSAQETYVGRENARVEAMRADREAWTRLLESLLLDAEDVAIRRGDYGLCECLIERDAGPEIYQSQTCASVINNIRERYPKNTPVRTK